MAQATEGILNITNGDCAVEIMSSASLPGRYLPWRDILHEGPVPAGLTLEALSDVRAAAIAGRGWGDGEAIRTSFAERDAILRNAGHYQKIRLWFEHDLYDQLQLGPVCCSVILRLCPFLKAPSGACWKNTRIPAQACLARLTRPCA